MSRALGPFPIRGRTTRQNAFCFSQTDADFVENIRTDIPTPRKTLGKLHYMSGIGASGPVGHVDFIPNGGKQPKCESRTLLETRKVFNIKKPPAGKTLGT